MKDHTQKPPDLKRQSVIRLSIKASWPHSLWGHHYLHVYIYIYINTNVRIYIYTYFHICIYKYIQIFVYTYIYYIHTCNYVYCIHIKLMLTVSFFTNNSEHSISLMSLVFFRGSGFGVVVKEGVWLLATIREESCDVSLLSQKSAPKKTFLGVKIPTLG